MTNKLKFLRKGYPPQNKLNICVIGLGYVGLPLAIDLAKRGFQVIAIDIVEHVIDLLLSRNKSHIPDVSKMTIEEVINRTKLCKPILIKKLYILTRRKDRRIIADNDVFIICVPTPLHKKQSFTPELKYIRKAVKIIRHSIRIDKKHNRERERLVILESTTFPGCTEKLIVNELSKKVINIFFAYSPERIDPGRDRGQNDPPNKIIGSNSIEGYNIAKYVYQHIYHDKIANAQSLIAAELIKCAENSFRLISISLANEFAHNLGNRKFDLWSIIETMKQGNITFHGIFPKDIQDIDFNSVDDLRKYIFNCCSFLKTVEPDGSKNLIYKYVSEFYNKVDKEIYTNLSQSGLVKELTRYFYKISLQFCFQLERYFSDINKAENTNQPFQHIIKGILTKPYGLDVCYPGPGAGGHCIPIDPVYLYHHAKLIGSDFPLIKEAVKINDRCSEKVVELMKCALRNSKIRISQPSILILGVSYKSNLPDVRESRAEAIFRLLAKDYNKLMYFDPVFTKRQIDLYPDNPEEWNYKVKGITFQPERIKDLEGVETLLGGNNNLAVLIFCDHNIFLDMGIYKRLIQNKNLIVVDCHNAIQRRLSEERNHIYVLGKSNSLKMKV